MSNSPQPLQYETMRLYARDHWLAWSTTVLDEFVMLLQAMDDVYLTHQAKRAAAQAKRNSSKKGRSR